jgi:hypothetical protein
MKCAVSRAILRCRLTVRKAQELLRSYLGAVYPPGGSALGVIPVRTCLFVSSLKPGYKHPLLLNSFSVTGVGYLQTLNVIS